jgi:hypothetical protein
LTTVTFDSPSNLTDILDGLFWGCTLLTNLNLPDSVVKIAGSAFAGTGVDSLTVAGFITTGSLFLHLGQIVCCLGTPKSVVIPSTVREIGEKGFESVSSLVDLSFEEGVERIKSSAFQNCSGLRVVAFPASLVAIDESAFDDCRALCEVRFAGGSRLQSIGRCAFARCRLEKVCLPANVTEIDPFAFSLKTWPILTFDGPAQLLMKGDFVCLPDSVTMLRCLSRGGIFEIPAHIEVIGNRAFSSCCPDNVTSASGSRLREIGEEAFSEFALRSFTVPLSVEILGDRCFQYCSSLSRVTGEEPSRLKRIGERAFASCAIRSFTIPASVNEIDGSAFFRCRLEAIDIAAGNLRFIIDKNTLLTSDGTEIVRSFGFERQIFVPREVEVLQKSCFESLEHLGKLEFASGSKLRKICRSALSGCESLRKIVVPASVTEIEELALKGCIGLEECSIHNAALLTSIGEEAFAGCCCLRSFYVPKSVGRIGENCFNECFSLPGLRFGSGDTLKLIVRDRLLNEALEYLGFTDIWSQFQIDVDEGVSDLSFPGWIPIPDGRSDLTLRRHFG